MASVAGIAVFCVSLKFSNNLVRNMETDNRKLYPLRFVDEGADVPWGHVSYQVADLGFKDSMVDNGWFGGNTLSELMGTYLERVVGDDVFEFYGLQFPVMVKVMDVTGWQPLQMNASDEIAAERYDSFGKTALWYILEARPDSELMLGFNRDVDPSEFYTRCQEGSVREVMNIVRPRAGEAFLINPGTVFAAGPGLRIVEIAECSELAFNLHNWGVELPDSEELLLEEAFDLIDFRKLVPEPVTGDKLASCPEFVVTRLDLKDGLHIFSDQPGSFAVYFCVSGEAVIQVPVEDGKGGKSMESYTLKSGHSILVPSELNDFCLMPSARETVLLEALVEKRLIRDSYTNQEVEPDSIEEAQAPDPHVREWHS